MIGPEDVAGAVAVKELGPEPGSVSAVRVLVPIRIVSEQNRREHWAVRARRVKQHRAAVTLLLGRQVPPPFPVRVTLTRIAPRKLDYHDNLRSGFKAVADAVADWLQVDDRDPRVAWLYDQRRGRPREYAAEIGIEGLAGA